MVTLALAGFLAEPPQPRDEVPLVLAGDLAALPGLDALGMEEDGDDGHDEAVPHVEHADYLADQDPHHAQELQLDSEEDGAEDVAQPAGGHIAEDVLDGVSC